MTCKDCIHYEACKDKFAGLYKIRVDEPKKHLELNPKVENICSNFKDKSRFVELPCKVGETVHYITFWKNEYNYHLITNVTYDILYQLFHEMETGYVVFMTDEKSKAEAKLKELNEK